MRPLSFDAAVLGWLMTLLTGARLVMPEAGTLLAGAALAEQMQSGRRQRGHVAPFGAADAGAGGAAECARR